MFQQIALAVLEKCIKEKNMGTKKYKNIFYSIYCWYEYFDKGNYSVPPYTTFILIGHSLVTLFLLICWLFISFNPPSREIFYSIVIGKVLLTAYFIVVWVFPLISSIIAISGCYKKMIQKNEYKHCETRIRDRLKKIPAIIEIGISMLLFGMPYFLTIILIVFFEVFVYC